MQTIVQYNDWLEEEVDLKLCTIAFLHVPEIYTLRKHVHVCDS